MKTSQGLIVDTELRVEQARLHGQSLAWLSLDSPEPKKYEKKLNTSYAYLCRPLHAHMSYLLFFPLFFKFCLFNVFSC